MKQVIVIGAGHNGLVTAFYLARAGFKPLVLERRSVVGGAAATEEIAPGYKCPALTHAISGLRPQILRDMGLKGRLRFLRPDARVTALSPDARALVLWQDVARTAESIRAWSAADAARYPEFCGAIQRMAGFLQPLLDSAPPSLTGAPAGDLWHLLQTGRRFRGLGRADGYRLLRWMPMAVADLASEWFTTDLLQAVIAAPGIFGMAAGPWSAGTAAVLLLKAAVDPAPGGSSLTVEGGPGALGAALARAARDAGATIRCDTAVSRILVHDGQATGVVLSDGSEIPARAVVSNADPKRTLLGMVDPLELDPAVLHRMSHYRMSGAVGKMNVALSALPEFHGVSAEELRGRLHIGPTIDYLEKAYDASKYGELSPEPYLDISIPSLLDSSLCAPGRHVMSVHVQFAPYTLARGASWGSLHDEFADTVIRTLERYAPGIRGCIEHGHVLTPADLEERYGLTGGHVYHGELALDQLFSMRPMFGWARYRTPIPRLFLCGAGTHPGGDISGASGRNAAMEIVKALKE